MLIAHYAIRHSFYDRERFNVEWMVKEMCMDDQNIVHCMLSDYTMIGKESWASLKEEAMKDYFKTQPMYHRMSANNKILLQQLKDAQKAQGDMEALQAGSYNTKKAIQLQDLEIHIQTCRSCPALSRLAQIRMQEIQKYIAAKHVNKYGIQHQLRGLSKMFQAMKEI